MTRVKTDAGLPLEVAEMCRARAMDAVSVQAHGWSGRPDAEIIRDVQPEGRWLLTADKGFADIRRYPPGTHRGIVCFRADRESRGAYVRLAAALLDAADLAQVAGSLVVVSPRGVRVVRASIA